MRSHDGAPCLRPFDMARGDIQQKAVIVASRRLGEASRKAKIRNGAANLQRAGTVVGGHQQRDIHRHRTHRSFGARHSAFSKGPSAPVLNAPMDSARAS